MVKATESKRVPSLLVCARTCAGLEKCKKIALDLEDVRPLVLFNPRLAR